MKKAAITLVFALVLSLALSACAQQDAPFSQQPYATFTDALGYEVTLAQKPERVVCTFSSYCQLWLAAGGTLQGVTEDAVTQRQLPLPEDVEIIGTVQHPNLEMIMSLSPDFVFLTADLQPHRQLHDALTQAGIPHAYFKVDSIDEYLQTLKICTDLTGEKQRYEQLGTQVAKAVQDITQQAQQQPQQPKILLIRSTTTKAKALQEEHMVGKMLADLGCVNIAQTHDSMLEDLSLEIILQEDPDFIFVVTTGDEQQAIEQLKSGIMQHPAWSKLTAIQNQQLHLLPKELFQYKPNDRWGESYAYLYEVLYGQA